MSGSYREHGLAATSTRERFNEAADRLLTACQTRFPAPEFEVSCDHQSSVWVKRADGTRSIGMAPWQLREHTTEEVVRLIETKLGLD